MTILEKRLALDFIREHHIAFGKGPTMRQIVEKLDLCSTSQAHRLVVDLELEGRIRRPCSKGGRTKIVPVPVTAVIAVELPAELYAEVQAVARHAGVSLASVVIEAVRDGFKHLPFSARSTVKHGATNGGW